MNIITLTLPTAFDRIMRAQIAEHDIHIEIDDEARLAFICGIIWGFIQQHDPYAAEEFKRLNMQERS